ncbi:MAG: zinc ribbon domain-containing protein [Chloroflexota bacterium]
MKRIVIWISVIAIILLALWLIPTWFMVDQGWVGVHRGMMGGFPMGVVPSGYSALGWLWMLSRLLIPLGLLILVIAGGIYLGNLISKRGVSDSPASAQIKCEQCGQPSERNWKVCPYCGTSLQK